MSTPRPGAVRCLSRSGFHTMRYTEWGAADNPRVLVCAHGLTRVGDDFSHLAQDLSDSYRVVCPDVVGRGRSDWLADPTLYGLPQYAFDMATLLARLNVDRVDFLGTSMGGLIGMSLAGQPNAPIGRLILNDIGPRLQLEALVRIGNYVGEQPRFADFDQAIEYVRSISAGFGLRTAQQWRELTEPAMRFDGSNWVFRYDPGIALSVKAPTAEGNALAEAKLWQLYDAIQGPVLLVRGAESDLLSRAAAEEMTRRGPRAQLVEIPQVGHAPMFFDPLQIAIVRRFLLDP
ncbi:MAG TPA: alpha/beta hydrolase [Burkholderiaceae bacterium]